jgi:hypothetical protein
MNLAILPLAVTMLAGPQIMSAIIFITSAKPVRNSLAFIIGVGLAGSATPFHVFLPLYPLSRAGSYDTVHVSSKERMLSGESEQTQHHRRS